MSDYAIIVPGVILGLVLGLVALRMALVRGLVSSGFRTVGQTVNYRKSWLPGFGYVDIRYTNRGRPYVIRSILTRTGRKPYTRIGALSPWYVSRMRDRTGRSTYVAIKYGK